MGVDVEKMLLGAVVLGDEAGGERCGGAGGAVASGDERRVARHVSFQPCRGVGVEDVCFVEVGFFGAGVEV